MYLTFLSPSLASLSFASPAWGGALVVAVGLPVLVHWLSRRSARRAMFPAVRFVQQALAETARLHRPQRWLLLALRTLALVLIVLGFMQPRWQRAATMTIGSPAVSVLLDRSASMQRSQRGIHLFDEARRQALDRLRQLESADVPVSLVLVDRHPRPLLPEPTRNIPALIARLQTVEPTFERGRSAEAIRQALALHRQQGHEQGGAAAVRLEIFADAQATQWSAGELAEFTEHNHDLADRLDIDVRWHKVALDTPSSTRSPADNLALTRPSLVPSEPIRGQPAMITAELLSHAHAPADLTVRLHIDGEPRQVRHVRLDPRQRRTVSFQATFETVGAHVVQLTLEEPRGAADSLTADNAVGRVILVRAARPVRLITQSDIHNPATAAYFLARALQPKDSPTPQRSTTDQPSALDRSRGFSAGVKLSVHRPAELAQLLDRLAKDTPENTSDLGTFVLAEAGRLPEPALVALSDHLRRGGGAVWVVDSPDAVASLRDYAALGDSAAPSPVQPAPLDQAWRVDRAHRQGVSQGAFTEPAMALFDGPARGEILRQHFAAVMAGEPSPHAAVLLHYENGAPALAVQRTGHGALAVWTASLAPDDTDFGRSAMFVPVLHQLLRHLTPGRPLPPNPHPGAALPPLDEPARWHSPTGDPLSPAQVHRVDRPGPYTQRTGAASALQGGTWVELDPAESDLQHADLPARMDGTNDAGVSASEAATRTAVELWPWLILLALGMLAAEAALLLVMQWRGRGVAPGEVEHG